MSVKETYDFILKKIKELKNKKEREMLLLIFIKTPNPLNSKWKLLQPNSLRCAMDGIYVENDGGCYSCEFEFSCSKRKPELNISQKDGNKKVSIYLEDGALFHRQIDGSSVTTEKYKDGKCISIRKGVYKNSRPTQTILATARNNHFIIQQKTFTPIGKTIETRSGGELKANESLVLKFQNFSKSQDRTK